MGRGCPRKNDYTSQLLPFDGIFLRNPLSAYALLLTKLLSGVTIHTDDSSSQLQAHALSILHLSVDSSEDTLAKTFLHQKCEVHFHFCDFVSIVLSRINLQSSISSQLSCLPYPNYFSGCPGISAVQAYSKIKHVLSMPAF